MFPEWSGHELPIGLEEKMGEGSTKEGAYKQTGTDQRTTYVVDEGRDRPSTPWKRLLAGT